MSIVFFTNCQGPFIYNNWLSNLEYFKNYEFIHVLNYTNNDSTVQKNIEETIESIKLCDIFVYQPVNGITTESDGILSFLKPSCKTICFPTIYADMWPIYEKNNKYFCGNCMDKYLTDDYTINDIIELYDTHKFDFELKSRFEKSIQYLKLKEDKYCDIKVSDFILEHYKSVKLFDTQNHPNGILGSFVANEICKCLNIPAPVIDVFTQENIILFGSYYNSFYMKKELDLKYINDENSIFYRDLLIEIYNNPKYIDTKTI